MGYYVSSLTMLQSANCPHAFSCLQTGECASAARCKMAEVNSTMALLTNKDPLETCSYRLAVGPRQFCMCPTFVALSNQKKAMSKASTHVANKKTNEQPYHGETL